MPDFKKQLATFVQMLRNIEDEFKLHSLTPNEQAVFYTILKSKDICNISKIVDESGLSRSTVYKILRKLENNNLIEALQSILVTTEYICNGLHYVNLKFLILFA